MYIVAILALGLLLVYYNYLLLVFSPSKSAPFRWDQLKVLLKIQEFSLTFSAAKDFSMCFLLLLCCTYLFTALSNSKHQKLSGADTGWNYGFDLIYQHDKINVRQICYYICPFIKDDKYKTNLMWYLSWIKIKQIWFKPTRNKVNMFLKNYCTSQLNMKPFVNFA